MRPSESTQTILTATPHSGELGAICSSQNELTLWRRICTLLLAQRQNLQSLSVLVIVNFAVAAVGFVTQVKIANTIGKYHFGLIAYGLAIAAYGGAVIRFGLDRTLVRDLVHYPDRFSVLVNASLVMRGVLFILVISAMILWKLLSSPDSDLTWGILMIVIANSMMSLDLQAVYDCWKRMSRHAIYNLSQRGLYFMLIWAAILFAPERLSVSTIGVTTLISMSMYLLLQHLWAFRRLPQSRSNQMPLSLAWTMAKGNIIISLAAIGYLSFGTLNQLILKHYRGSAELGSYAAAWTIVSIANLFLMQVARVGNPVTARITAGQTSKQERFRFLLKYSAVMFVVALPISISAIVCPKLILGTIFKPEYAVAANALRVLGGYIMVFALGIVASQYVISARLERLYLLSVLLGGIVSLLLCFLLVPSMGDFGAAVALIVSYGTSMGLYWLSILYSLRRDRPPYQASKQVEEHLQ